MIPTLIVPTLVHYDLLQNMLDSIDYPIDNIIIIDNGGKLNSIHCKMANNVHTISLPSNLGVAASWNLGIKLTPFSKWWLISNDDILWNPGKLQSFASNIEEKSIVADWTPLSAFSGFAIDEKTIEIVGLFDEYYYPACGEEVNYWRRANKNGVTGINIPNAFSLQGGIGRSRQYLENINKKMIFIISNNLTEGIMSQENIYGWSIVNRRKNDISD